MRTPFRWLERRHRTGDGGFTLLEVVVALSIGGVLATVTAGGIMYLYRLTATAREYQQAAEILLTRVEAARALPYTSLAMDPTTLSGDSRITSTGSGWTASLDGGLTEPIYTPRTGEVAGVARVIPVSSTTPATYTVNQYVTAPANCACKRVSVVASWTDRGIARTRWTSTVITPAYRSWSLNRTTVGTPLTGTRGTEFAIGVTLINTSVPASGGSNPTFSVSIWAPTDWGTATWYVDTNGDGIREANETTVATMSGGNATVSVPLGGSVQLLADFTPPTTATSRTSVTVSAVPLNVPASGGQTLPVPVVLS